MGFLTRFLTAEGDERATVRDKHTRGCIPGNNWCAEEGGKEGGTNVFQNPWTVYICWGDS